MDLFITYSDSKFLKQKKFSLFCAKNIGGFKKVIGFSPENIDIEFYKENKFILDQKRGAGYWLWKPYIIFKCLNEIKEGEFLFYSDAGVFFTRRATVLFETVAETSQDVFAFELPLIEKQWTRREVFAHTNTTDRSDIVDSNQLLASFIIFRKSNKSLKFVNDWLCLCKQDILISDDLIQKDEQDSCFIDHRHDQSIFSVLYKVNGFTPFLDPSQFGVHPEGYSGMENTNDVTLEKQCTTLSNGRIYAPNYRRADYSECLYRNRNQNPLVALAKYHVKKALRKLCLYKGIIR